MRSRGVLLAAALFSLTVVAALSASSCSSVEPKPSVPPPEEVPALQVTNPVLPGDFPDPSVIRVGNEYWASATSAEWAPQYPLLRSTDLRTWELAGFIFPEPPTWSEAQYWAPELTEDNGTFYVFYTARKKGGPLCVAVATAAKVSGPYTDHGPLVCQPLGSIDGVLIRDENNKLYMVWKEDGNSKGLPTPFWAQPLSATGTSLEGEPRQIMLNDVPWEGQLIEGPHLIKRGEYFYMFYAGAGCCGKACNYGVGVARSKKLLEGWEKHPLNPIMKNNEHWRCPGHGTVVTDTAGRDHFLYHAYSTKDTVYVGRQGVLDPITWGEDGWPSINQRRGVGGQLRAKAPAFSDEFNLPAPIIGWVWPNGRKPAFSTANGMLTLAAPAAQASDVIGGVLARTTTTGNYTAETTLELNGLATGTVAGLAAYGDEQNTLGIGYRAGAVELWLRERNNHRVDTTVPVATTGGKLHLRMVARTGSLFRFSVSTDGTTWTDVGGELKGEYLPPWDRGVRVALTVGGAPGASARFEMLRITPE
jgi:xylan 1,4-beta-xylosidase